MLRIGGEIEEGVAIAQEPVHIPARALVVIVWAIPSEAREFAEKQNANLFLREPLASSATRQPSFAAQKVLQESPEICRIDVRSDLRPAQRGDEDHTDLA